MKNYLRLKRIALIYLLIITSFLCSCDKEKNTTKDYKIGENRYTIEIDGDEREYYVHVPSNYKEEDDISVVFMLHGTSGNGKRFYNISGWKEVGESNTILTVYPSSWKYCVIKDGEIQNTTKWNVFPGSFEYCEGEKPKDDVKFLRSIVDEINHTFSIDNERIYISGFSNGGQMSGRCAIEMSDVFAAAVQSSGTLPRSTIYTPQSIIPVTFQVGNADEKWFGDDPISLFDFETILLNDEGFKSLVFTYINSFDLQPECLISGDPTSFVFAKYESNEVNSKTEFNFIIINDLGHNYPNGINHELNAAELNWGWMKQFNK